MSKSLAAAVSSVTPSVKSEVMLLVLVTVYVATGQGRPASRCR